MWTLSDETLLAGLGSDDPESATAFVRRFQGRIFGLVVTILGNPKDAEEAAQETFVRAWRHASAYDPRRGAVATWLLTIARNVAIDMLRVRKPDPIDPEGIASFEMSLVDRRQDEHNPSIEDADMLRAALRGLPEDQRRALVLAAFYGRTAREIGEMDGVPIGTVKTRIRAAMFKLRSAMDVGDG
jgi:RNA polymerase sigma-70 factor (ECF subfamily)